MSHPDQTPKLSTWIFFITDAALLAAAWFIADRSARPLSGDNAFAIVGCVVAGAIVALVPLIVSYERRKNETLDQRQRELEALGRTISSSAEQISIAANGFNEITDLAHKNLKQAELLPHRLQEKVAEFNAQLDNAREDDREELEKELVELRASESERLQLIADKVHKSVLELSKLDAVAQKHVAARTELTDRTGETFAKAQADATRAFNEATATATRQFAAAQAKALAEIETKLAAYVSSAVAAIASATAQAKSNPPSPAAISSPQVDAPFKSPQPVEAPSPQPANATAAPDATAPGKRPKKIRHDDNVTPPPTAVAPSVPTVSAVSVSSEPATPSILGDSPLSAPPGAAPAASPTTEAVQKSIAAATNGSVTDVAAASPAAEASDLVHSDGVPQTMPEQPAASAGSAAPTGDQASKKRSARKSSADATGELTLELSTEDFSPPSYDEGAASGADIAERVISSDGATRLVVTAYIGIGNRLFIRGDGPGLSWEKGVPLQFISIGKWRWETADAAAPVTVKLYKNDEIECAALGAITLDPAHQQEVTARF